MKHLYSLSLLMGLAFSATAQYSATISVTDLGTGLPLPNATVELGGNTLPTDLAGQAVFTDLADNTYDYFVSAVCYTTAPGSLTIAGADASSSVALEPFTTNAVFFFVGSPLSIPGATIFLTDGMDYNETITTGAPFGDIFENVPFGAYSYTITIPCYQPVSGTVTVDCTNGDGIAVFVEPVALTTNAVFFFVGSPLTIAGAEIFLSDGADYNETIITGAPFGDIFENVPFGAYSYTITIPCYQPVSGTVTVDCTNGDGIAVFVEPVEVALDVTVSLVGSTLTATATEVDYQWIDCATNEPIEGATEQSFEATENGSYAVILTSGTCSQTSACTVVTITGAPDLQGMDPFAVYPNPFQDLLLVRSTAATGAVRVELFSTSGSIVLDQTHNGLQLITVNTAQLPAGSYIVRLTANNVRTTYPVVK